jgi:hypothetical protein
MTRSVVNDPAVVFRNVGDRRIKAEDIDGDRLLAQIYLTNFERSEHDRCAGWVQSWDLREWYPDVPYKVVLAKVRSLKRRGLLDGCTCGCRGDFEMTAAGIAHLQALLPPA